MFLARSVFLLFIIISLSPNYSGVSSSFSVETIFHRLPCQKGFHVAAPNLQSKLEGALYHCITRYSNADPDTSKDCLNFCMAQEIQMFSYAGSHIEFNKTNLIRALNEWFGGADGPKIVKVIANDFEGCVKQHSHILSQDPSCLPNSDMKSDQTVLWKCFQTNLKPCETEAQNENGADNPNLDKRKFDRIIM
ncbi:unnamed protein product [Orchesella dallaii]|uniref:Uncharacterized protein n=1 Tax=Orchesella dallaii TaxID=48710 RepID=A0ABP1S257_9HEXA